MASYSKNVWNQLKNTTAHELQSALVKDGWTQEETSGAVQAYANPTIGKRVTIHVHPKKTYGAKFLKGLLDYIEWTEDDMKRLKLIK